MIYYVYILINEKRNVYIGHTENLARRLFEHNNNHSNYTRNKGVWKVLYTETFQTRAEAIKKEKQLKTSRGRNWIKITFLSSASVG